MKIWAVAMVVAIAAAASPCCAAEHVGIWAGYGVGLFLQGGPGLRHIESQREAGLSVSFAGDRLRFRAMAGSVERTDLPIPGDNDADYQEFDLVLTRQLTHWPIDVAAGPTRFDQNFPQGYPERVGERIRELRWGEHLSLIRDWSRSRRLAIWSELSFQHVAFPEARETFATLDIGLRIRI
jgi:hypothetical protein